MVPNIKDAQELSLRELAIALNNLTTRAREGKTQPAEMANGTLTITNIGSLGIDTGTPIINPGEVAIVAFGTIKQKPWVVDGEVIPRWVTTLGGSFDHRVVDGDLSARFMAVLPLFSKNPPCFWICSADEYSNAQGRPKDSFPSRPGVFLGLETTHILFLEYSRVGI